MLKGSIPCGLGVVRETTTGKLAHLKMIHDTLATDALF
jgi:hypothetical protein